LPLGTLDQFKSNKTDGKLAPIPARREDRARATIGWHYWQQPVIFMPFGRHPLSPTPVSWNTHRQVDSYENASP